MGGDRAVYLLLLLSLTIGVQISYKAPEDQEFLESLTGPPANRRNTLNGQAAVDAWNKAMEELESERQKTSCNINAQVYASCLTVPPKIEGNPQWSEARFIHRVETHWHQYFYFKFEKSDGTGAGDHHFWVAPHTDGTCSVVQAWQNMHELREEVDRTPEETAADFTTIFNNGGVITNAELPAANRIFGDDHEAEFLNYKIIFVNWGKAKLGEDDDDEAPLAVVKPVKAKKKKKGFLAKLFCCLG